MWQKKPGSGLTFGHDLDSRAAWTSWDRRIPILGKTPFDVEMVELVSECQTSYIEDASAPVDNHGDVAGRGDTVQTECH